MSRLQAHKRLALTAIGAFFCLPAVAFAAWVVASPVDTRSSAVIASLLEAPGLAFGAPAETAMRALGTGALYGPTCGGRTAVTANVQLAGTTWHVMAFTHRERVSAVELVSLGSQSAGGCKARIAALEQLLTEQHASVPLQSPVERRQGFARLTSMLYTLADGTEVALNHRRWVDDGSCDLTVRFTGES